MKKNGDEHHLNDARSDVSDETQKDGAGEHKIIAITCLCNKLQFFTAVRNDNFQMKNFNNFPNFTKT